MVVLPVDKVHAFAPVTHNDCTGLDWPASVVYSSTYTGAPTPVVMAAPPLPTRTTARPVATNGAAVPVGVAVGVTDPVGVREGVALCVREDVDEKEDVGVSVPVGVNDGALELVAVDDGETVFAGVVDAVDVSAPVLENEEVPDIVWLGVPVLVTVELAVCVVVLVTDGVKVNDAEFVGDTVVLGVTVNEDDCVRVPVCVVVAVRVPVGVTEGVLVDVDEHDAHVYTAEYGATVTPRNAVLAGAVAREAFTSITVLYEYSVVGEVAYNINTPHDSFRPAIEMIIAPDSSSMAAVGVCRAHDVVFTYLAMLLVVSAAVSVDQMVAVLENTNPYGFVLGPNMSATVGRVAVGRPVNDRIPAPLPPPTVSVQYNWVDVATSDPDHPRAVLL